jgi:hypothetical protein
MREKLIIAAKFIASFPIAWFGGNIIFGILASGSWLPDFLHMILRDWAFDLVVNSFIWIFRIGILVALLIGWVFQLPTKATPQSK